METDRIGSCGLGTSNKRNINIWESAGKNERRVSIIRSIWGCQWFPCEISSAVLMYLYALLNKAIGGMDVGIVDCVYTAKYRHI